MKAGVDVGGTKTIIATDEGVGCFVTPAAERELIELLRSEAPDATELCIAMAGPPANRPCRLTNHRLSFSPETLKAELSADRVEIVNDLHAAAAGLPELGSGDFVVVHQGAESSGSSVVVGIGTGLGVSIVSPRGEAVAGEGGHVGVPEGTVDPKLLKILKGRHGRVSAERIVSGTGLASSIEALSGRTTAARAVVERRHSDPDARVVIESFLATCGAMVGDLVLAVTASRVWLTGGVAAANPDLFRDPIFVEHFSGKGRMRDVVERASIAVVTSPNLVAKGALRIAKASS